MTGTKRSSEGLEVRRRKLLYRSWHCGMRELDLILGPFADARIGALTDAELDQYERLIAAPDSDLLTWITGERQTPEAYATPVMAQVKAHCRRTPA